MVSFQCESCGDVLTKKKLDQHVNRCANAHFSCIDCMKTFYDYSYRAHTTCMTEEQKTHGSLYKGNEKRQRAPKPANAKMPAPTTPSDERTLAKLDVPPPAPSPPRASQGVNVFDFMVRQDSPASGASTPRRSNGGASPRALHHDHDDRDAKDDVSYGAGPVRRGLQHFDSDASALKMQVDDQFAPTVNHTPLYKDAKTPVHNGRGTKSTEKKRKRPQVDDLDLSDAVNDSSDARRSTLHTGLTGGLTRLLTKASQRDDDVASPLSPKKRSKHKARPDESDDADESDEERRRRRKERRQSKHKRHRSDGDDMQLVRTDPAARQVELHASSSARHKPDPHARHQLPEQANSEFFLSLVDKDHTSSKGQSIWGTLKTFHDGLQSDSMEDAFDLAGAHQRAEKRLFKGLRMKLNRHGEVVLFAKPDKEDE